MIKIISEKTNINVDESMRFFNEMKEKGLKVKNNKEIIKDLKYKIKILETDLKNKFGIEKRKSTKEIDTKLYKEIKAEHKSYIYINGKKKYSKIVMKELANLGYTWAIYFVELSEIDSKLKSYLDIENNTINGLIHPEISIAKSGRINYKKPGLMAISPKILWDNILPKSDDFELYSVDIRSQEPLILINMMNIKELINKIKESRDKKDGKGVYDIIFEHVYNKEASEDELDEFKTCWVALGYGATKNGLREIAELIDTDLISEYFKSIKGYKKYKSEVNKKVKNLDQMMTTYFGREVYANEVKKKLLNTMMNIGIQGTGVDLLFIIMKSIEEKLRKDKLQDKITLYFTRHDELIFNVHKSLDEEFVKNYLAENLEHQVDNWIPFNVKVDKIK